ncbi:transporter substrate-binding domain-containing protein [Bifidobacterium choloepi]|nr:transporter substrate-binding domain-containing protein [Bifidobacterium choloepi]
MSTLAALLAVGALAGTAACGGTASDSSNAAAADDKAATTLTVAVAANSKPLSYTNDNGELDGYEYQVLKAVDDLLDGYDLNIEAVADDAEDIGIDTGKYALTAGGYFKTAKREEKYLLPSVNSGVSLMRLYTTKDRTDINTLDDLVGKVVAPISPSGGVNNLLAGYNEEHSDAQIDLTYQEDLPIADRFSGLLSGKYDAVVIPQQSFDLDSIESALGATFRGSEPVQVNNQYFLINKDYEDFAARVDEALATLKDNGTLTSLSKKYFGTDVFQYEDQAVS